MIPPSLYGFDKKFKILFVMYNMVLWSTGLILVWFGVWIEVEMSRYVRVNSVAVSYLLLAVGSFLVLYNAISCFCILKLGSGASALLNANGLVLGILFVAELFLSMSMIWVKRQVEMKLNSHGTCCGVNGVTDWNGSPPESCCISAHCDTQNVENLWPKHCFNQMTVFMDDNIGIMSILVLSFAAVALVGVYGSFTWAKKISGVYEPID